MIYHRTASSPVTLAVLAGGESSRMGMPKSHLQIQGQYILPYLLNQWNWPEPTLLVTAPGREHPPGRELFGREVSDPVAGQGPLRGLLTALENVETESIVFATVDMPGIQSRQLLWFCEALRERAGLLGIMVAWSGQSGRIEPFPCALRRSAISLLRDLLDQEKRSVRGLAECPGFVVEGVPDDWPQEAWINLNSPHDFDSWHNRL